MIVPAVELMKKKERKILLPSVANIRFYSQLISVQVTQTKYW